MKIPKKYFKVSVFLSVIFWFCLVEAKQPSEHIAWENEPIRVLLPVGQEKILKFNERVSVDSKISEYVRVINANNTLYIMPRKIFENKRMYVKNEVTGVIYLIDLGVNESASGTTIEIVDTVLDDKYTDTNIIKSVNQLQISRFAVQQFYALERLVEPNLNIYRVPMNTTKYINIYPGDSIKIQPIAQWRGGDYYITALSLKNKGNRPEEIDIRLVRGRWVSGIVYPKQTVMPKGNIFDETMMFLISKKSFSEVVSEVIL